MYKCMTRIILHRYACLEVSTSRDVEIVLDIYRKKIDDKIKQKSLSNRICIMYVYYKYLFFSIQR